MSNPAKLLADLIDQWRTEHGDVVTTIRRGPLQDESDDLKFWQAQRRAVGYLEEIDTALKGMEEMGEDVEHFRSQFPAWHQFVFATEVHWGASPSGGVILDTTSHYLLRALAQYLETTNYAPAQTIGDLYVLQQSITEARELVLGIKFPSEIARALLALLREAEDIIVEHRLYGAVRLRTVTLQLSSAMLMASGNDAVSQDPEKVSNLRRVAGKIMLGVAVGMGTHVGVAGLEEFFGLEPGQHQVEIDQAPQPLELERGSAGDVEA